MLQRLEMMLHVWESKQVDISQLSFRHIIHEDKNYQYLLNNYSAQFWAISAIFRLLKNKCLYIQEVLDQMVSLKEYLSKETLVLMKLNSNKLTKWMRQIKTQWSRSTDQ